MENTGASAGVRRMLATAGPDAPFDHGRQQMKLLADLEVTTKLVERTVETGVLKRFRDGSEFT